MNQRVDVWAMGGIGSGEMRIAQDGAEVPETDISMRMGARLCARGRRDADTRARGGLAPDDDFEAGRRLETEVGYGLDAPVGVVTPFAGFPAPLPNVRAQYQQL